MSEIQSRAVPVCAIALGLLLAAAMAHAQPAAVLLGEGAAVAAAPEQIAVLRDASGQLALQDVSRSPWSERFQSPPPSGFNFGVSGDAIWLRFLVHNGTPRRRWVLIVDNPRLERVDLFVSRNRGPAEHWTDGDLVAQDSQAIAGREIAFPLAVAEGETVAVHLRVQSSVTLVLPLRLLTPRRFERESRVRGVMMGGLLGIMALISLIALWFLARYRDLRLLSYFAANSTGALFFAAQESLTTEYFWPGHPEWTWPVRAASNFVFAACSAIYIVLSLTDRRRQPWLFWLGTALAGAALAIGALVTLLPPHAVNRITHGLGSIIAVMCLSVIVSACYRRHPLAYPFALSFLPLAAAIFVAQANNVGWYQGPSWLIVDGFKAAFLFLLVTHLIALRGEAREEESGRLLRSRAEALPPGKAPGERPLLIQTLGRYAAWRNGQSVNLARRDSSRVRQMLALILAGGEEGVPKHFVVDALWPDGEGDRAEQAYRTTLHRLRRSLGPDSTTADAGVLRLASAVVWVDSRAFEATAVELLARIMGGDTRALAHAESTLGTYGGDFLPGVNLPPVKARREQLRNLMRELLAVSSSRHPAQGQAAGGPRPPGGPADRRAAGDL
jgi:hypothetical protein